MTGIDAKSFGEPDETIRFDHGHVDLVKVGSLTIGREVLDRGWRWSTHVKPIVGTEWCEFHHVTFMIAGRMRVVTRDGDDREVAAGEVYDLAPGHDAWVVGDEPVIAISFQGVVGWAKPPEGGDRILTTILLTDIVGSTAAAERLGDAGWRRLLAAHDENVRSLLELYRGREVKTTGDGFLATFDGPARAIACALAIASGSRKLGIDVRAGVHSGEVEVHGDDLRGVAVHLAARIVEAAEPGQVLVSATSRELASGADIEFADRGSHVFRGIAGPRHIYEARRRSER